MSLIVLSRTPGSDAYLLVTADRENTRDAWIYERATDRVTPISNVASLVGNGSWLAFDGDEAAVLRWARNAAPALPD